MDNWRRFLLCRHHILLFWYIKDGWNKLNLHSGFIFASGFCGIQNRLFIERSAELGQTFLTGIDMCCHIALLCSVLGDWLEFAIKKQTTVPLIVLFTCIKAICKSWKSYRVKSTERSEQKVFIKKLFCLICEITCFNYFVFLC